MTTTPGLAAHEAAIQFCAGVDEDALVEMNRAGGLKNVLKQFCEAKAEIARLEREAVRRVMAARGRVGVAS